MAANPTESEASKTLNAWRDLIDRELVNAGQGGVAQSESLTAATTYVLQGNGKRLRGLLAVAVQSDISGKTLENPYALRPALALEMLHAASLVHDDLPALDNDDMRRGRPSCHRAFNEATAILTGDYLVGRAFSVVADGSLSSMQQLRVLGILAQAWSDLCIGQQFDIEAPRDSRAKANTMELKTGALFGASAACGVVCADGDDTAVSAFYAWGKRVGVLFQKLDDLADGDGQRDSRFERGVEAEKLASELATIHPGAMSLTRAVYGAIVGQTPQG